MTFRWYGADDRVTLAYIRQIPGLVGIVSALYDIPPGAVWPLERILALKASIESAGLAFDVVESIPRTSSSAGPPATPTSMPTATASSIWARPASPCCVTTS